MRARAIAAAIAVALSLALAGPGFAAAPAGNACGVAVEGAVQTPLHLCADDLKKLPATTVTIAFEGRSGKETGAFTGVLLTTVLERAGVVDGEGKGAQFRHALTATGRDGYAAVLAMGEIAPMLEGKQVLVAYAKDGKPLPKNALRLIVPGDKHGARSVIDLVKLTVQ